MPEPHTAPEVARLIADALERDGLPYAIGGALALGFYAPPRATLAVDVNVFVPPDTQLEHVLSVLERSGFASSSDPAVLRAQALSDGQMRGSMAGLRVDVFVPAIAYYAELATRRRQVQLLGRDAWILGPEDLVVLKVMFFRRKDLADVEAVLRDQGPALDRAFVHRKLEELVGPTDERLAAFASIERDVARGD